MGVLHSSLKELLLFNTTCAPLELLMIMMMVQVMISIGLDWSYAAAARHCMPRMHASAAQSIGMAAHRSPTELLMMQKMTSTGLLGVLMLVLLIMLQIMLLIMLLITMLVPVTASTQLDSTRLDSTPHIR